MTALLHRRARLLQQHGLAAMLVGLLGGFVLVASLLGGVSASPLPFFVAVKVPGSAHGWLGFHLGMLMNGLMALVLGQVLRGRATSATRGLIISGAVIIAVWGNCAFYLFAMFAPNRGLTADANVFGPPSLWGYLAFFPALVGAVGLIAAVVLLLISPSAASQSEG